MFSNSRVGFTRPGSIIRVPGAPQQEMFTQYIVGFSAELINLSDLNYAATTYFKGVKRMPKDEDFDKLWRVMTEEQYLTQYKASLQNRQHEWWKEEKEITDSILKL